MGLFDFFRRKLPAKSDKIIDFGGHLENKEPSGIHLACHRCESDEYWAVYMREVDGKFCITGFACTSDECENNTFLHVGGGVIR